MPTPADATPQPDAEPAPVLVAADAEPAPPPETDAAEPAPPPDAAPPPPPDAPAPPDAAAPPDAPAPPDATVAPPDAMLPPDAPPLPPDAALAPDAAPPPPPPPPATGGLTDALAHPPTAVTLPAAGGSYVDPEFGTTIIRVTDSQDGTRCNHAYSYWPAFNADDTRLLIACEDVPRLYRFDPATGALAYDGALRGSDGPAVQFEGATWSPGDHDVVYALDSSGTRLWRINVAARGLAGYTLVKDFTGLIGGLKAYQLTMSDDEDLFSFHTRTSTGEKREAYAWRRSTGVLAQYARGTALVDETHVARGGGRVMINWQDGHISMWDPVAGTGTDYLRDATDKISGHFDLGHDFVANSDGWNTGILVRTWGAMHAPKNVLQYKKTTGALNWSIADHVSLQSAVETYATVSTYAGDGSWQPFEDEIFLVRTDGGGFVRLAHTRSYQASTNSALRYYAQPRAVVSRSGRFVVYTSDLASATRMDVMILKVPSGYWP